jgi:putative Holliday junction resolvase
MNDAAVQIGRVGAGSGRILAFDFGGRRIGVAVSDPLALSAQPLLTLERTTWKADLKRIRELVRRHEVGRIVVGLPLNMDGTRGDQVRLTEVFMERVHRATGLEVIAWDERLTTVQAEKALLEGDVSRRRRRAVIDQLAAVILLQAYLDAQRVGGAS